MNESANALIIGENGAGKSTILDAICFALFGKAFRKINKPLLVNSVNEKNCEVQIEFSTNGKDYKVIRGIKPNIFEIYCDDVLLNQDSASKDYQEHLEKFILKMNYKSFTQIVILGSASFVPFMQLSPADRRSVIEDLLDIQIFSVMNVIVKQKLLENKQKIELNRISLSSKEEKKSFVEKTIVSLQQNNQKKKDELAEQLELTQKRIADTNQRIAELQVQKEEVFKLAIDAEAARKKHTKLVSLSSKIDTNLKRSMKDVAFYCNNDNCPTCRQPIDAGFKATEIKANEDKIAEYEQGLSTISEQIDSLIKALDENDKVLSQAAAIQNEITSHNTHLRSLISKANEIEDELETFGHADKLLLSNQQELEETVREIEILSREKQDLVTDRQYIETAITLLKDGGIKTKIIKQYLPIINKLINKYLAKMGFFVNFNINEQFEETIKSRYRDEFSYQNFSEGEKTRIDLALLFTWRSIAKMRNSVNTNLLILDEVLDGSLDNNGTDEFLKIMWDMLGDTNTFVISHKTDTMQDKFAKVFKFRKIKNFSSLEA